MRGALVPLGLVVAAAVTAACDGLVFMPGECDDDEADCEDDTTSGGGTAPSGQGGGTGTLGSGATGGEFPTTGPGGLGGVGGMPTGGGGPIIGGIALLQSETSASFNPNALHVIFNDVPYECGDTLDETMPCGSHYKLDLIIYPENLHPGTITLPDPGAWSGFCWTGSLNDAGGCGNGCQGTGIEGSFTILSVDETQITIDASNMFGANAAGITGPQTALRCP